MNILADATLPDLFTAFPSPFKLTLYAHSNEIRDLLSQQDVLLCRSTLKVDQQLLQNHHLQFVATASSGTDHLDHQFLMDNHIQIIDAKGCNTESVADYILSSLAYLDENQLFSGKRAGIIGLGRIGTEVSRRLDFLGFETIHYDPPKAEQDLSFSSCTLSELYSCDFLCIHADLHDDGPYPSYHLINETFLKQLPKNRVIINAARGGIVDERALINMGKSLIYCTDVYWNEPDINPLIIEQATLCTPHIAGHSIEGKQAAVQLISQQLHRYAGLPPVQFNPIAYENLALEKEISWQKKMLSNYNPINETNLLKRAKDKRSAFLEVRKNHQFRHNFIWSKLEDIDFKAKTLHNSAT